MAMQVINPADLRGILSTPQTDIPLFYGDPSKDTVTPKFLMDRMVTAIATHNWTQAQAAGNFTLQLRGPALDWLEYIRDTEGIAVNTWATILPAFQEQYDLVVDTTTNVWNLTDLKHDNKEDPRNLVIKVSKIINEVKKSNTEFEFADVAAGYTAAAVRQILRDFDTHQTDHLKKTLLIKYLAPDYKNKVLARNPATLHEAKTYATEIWRRNNNGKSNFVKTEVSAIKEDNLTNFSTEALQNAINQKNSQTWREGNGNYQTQQGKNKKNKKKSGGQSQNPSTPSTSASTPSSNETRGNYKGNGPPIFCWYCKRMGHFQIKCGKRLDDNAPMIFKGKPVTSSSNKKIMAMSDFESTNERDEWHKKLKAQALLNPNEVGQDFH